MDSQSEEINASKELTKTESQKDVASVRKEKFPVELIIFIGVFFLGGFLVNLIFESPFFLYEIYGPGVELLPSFVVCYYIVWLVIRRIFENRHVNKWLVRLVVLVLAAPLTAVFLNVI